MWDSFIGLFTSAEDEFETKEEEKIIIPFPGTFPHNILRDILNKFLDPRESDNDIDYFIGFLSTFTLVSKSWNENIITTLNMPKFTVNSNRLFHCSFYWLVKKKMKLDNVIFDFKYCLSKLDQFKSNNLEIHPIILDYVKGNINILGQLKLVPSIEFNYQPNINNNNNNRSDNRVVLLEFQNQVRISSQYIELVKQFKYIRSIRLDDQIIQHERYSIILDGLLGLDLLEEFDARNIKKPSLIKGSDRSCLYLQLVEQLINRHTNLRKLTVMVTNTQTNNVLEEETQIMKSLSMNKTIEKFSSNIIIYISNLYEVLQSNSTLTFLDMFDSFMLYDIPKTTPLIITNESLEYLSLSNPPHQQIWDCKEYKLKYLDLLFQGSSDLTYFLFKLNNLVELEVETYKDCHVLKDYVIPLLEMKNPVFKYLKLTRPHTHQTVIITESFWDAIISHPSIETLQMTCYNLSKDNLIKIIQSNHPTLKSLEIIKNIIKFSPRKISRFLCNNKTIKSLNLSYSLLSDGICDLITSLVSANSIENLLIHDFNSSDYENRSSYINVTNLKKEIEKNTSLRSIQVQRYFPKNSLVENHNLFSKRLIHTIYRPQRKYKLNEKVYEKSQERIHQMESFLNDPVQNINNNNINIRAFDI